MIEHKEQVFNKFKYEKYIKISSDILAKVVKYGWLESENRWVELRTVDSKIFFFWFNGIKRANKWTDNLISFCLKNEIGTEKYLIKGPK